MDIKKEVKSLPIPPKVAQVIKFLTSPEFILNVINFAVTFILSRGIILGTAAPFGLAASAALCSSKNALYGLIGSALGYLSNFNRINSFRYIACIILIYTAHFVFSDTWLVKKRAFTPVSVVVPLTCINFIFIADAGFPMSATMLSLMEIVLATWCTVLFSYVTRRNTKNSAQFASGILTLSAALIIPLCHITFFETFSPGKMLAFCIVLLSAYSGGTGVGALVGMLFGIAVSLSLSTAEYCMFYGICGISSALNAKRGRLATIASAGAFTLFAIVCINTQILKNSAVEFFVASLLFYPLSNIFSRYTRRFFIKSCNRRDIHIRTYASDRLNQAANTFRALGHLLKETRHRAPEKETDLKMIFNRTSGEVCKKCKLVTICWERDFQSTRDALNNAIGQLKRNGTLSAKDFPMHFSSRCLHIENFVNSVNREIFAARYRAQFTGRLRESHELLTKQYSDASAIFSSIASDIANNAQFDEDAEIEIRDILASHGILCDTAVYRDSEGHINIHMCGKDLEYIVSEFDKLEKSISTAIGARISAPNYSRSEHLDDIVIRERPKLRGIFGASAKRRSGSDISGDSGSFFRPTNGKLAILLSDGMGSGKLAASESATSISLLEGLLKSGISPQSALETLQSALTLKSEYSSSFATLDLIYIDTFTGNAEVYKFGGAPTYIKRGCHVRRINASSLPVGMNLGKISSPDRTFITLQPGDFVIMTSDGIADGFDDDKLIQFISESKETSPKVFADALLAYSLTVYKKNDDMTVAALLIEDEE